MKKYVGLFIAWGLFLLSAVAFAAANYEENVVEAEGYGLSAAGSATEVQARLTARRAAIADAQRVLAEEMAAVQVDAETGVTHLTAKGWQRRGWRMRRSKAMWCRRRSQLF